MPALPSDRAIGVLISQYVESCALSDRWLKRSRQQRMPCSPHARHGSSQLLCCTVLVRATSNEPIDDTHGHNARCSCRHPATATAIPPGSSPCMPGLPPEWSDLAAWLWASATVSSRTMYVPFDPAGVLTPFGDLCNFVSPPPRVPPRMLGGASEL